MFTVNCQRDVFVLFHEPFEILRHYLGAKQFSIDQRLRLETPGWRVSYFSDTSLLDEEVKRQRAMIMQTLLVRRDCEYPFCEDLITHDAGVVDPLLRILAKLSSFIEILRLGERFELVEQFCLTASCVDIEICWSHNGILVSIRIVSVAYNIGSEKIRFRSEKKRICFTFSLLVFCFQSILLNRMYSRVLSRVMNWVKS